MILFSQAQLDAHIAKVLPMIPAGDNNAIIGTTDDTGAQVVLTVKFKSEDDRRHFSVNAVGRHEWTGDNSVGASLIYSWRT